MLEIIREGTSLTVKLSNGLFEFIIIVVISVVVFKIGKTVYKDFMKDWEDVK